MEALAHAQISRHAWKRFVERWEGERPLCYRQELQRLMEAAWEEDLGYGATVRMIKNGFSPARYFTTEGWRFVTDEEVSKILTIERSYLGYKKPNRKMRDKKRYGKR
ncbi:hypothetical protein [Oryzomonas rubra]|uniref:Uncharacterized protein n=1 Tax=Oryzomonas rubra TaxID=2509454 RepID=A0A5A9X7I3_9BACT|nr:hypothetical protein [Oryzomonas rubra]KAA0888754.1 hypothetical protein ET418_15350 [Oryzomonas rubra]